MLKKHIFKANRGEGKTRWLVDRAIEYQDDTMHQYYLGSITGYNNFCAQYEAQMHKKCPIQHWASSNIMYTTGYLICYSDDLLDSFKHFPIMSNAIEGDWFITMSAEDFEA